MARRKTRFDHGKAPGSGGTKAPTGGAIDPGKAPGSGGTKAPTGGAIGPDTVRSNRRSPHVATDTVRIRNSGASPATSDTIKPPEAALASRAEPVPSGGSKPVPDDDGIIIHAQKAQPFRREVFPRRHPSPP